MSGAHRPAAPLLALASLLALAVLPSVRAVAHGGAEHRHFAAGEPGDPRKPARTVRISMTEEDGDKRMLFVPDRVEVKRGEQVRFVLVNDGIYAHEFLLDTPERNQRHAEAMRKNPDMEHDDPNGTKVALATTKDLVWRFTKTGTFEFACLIPGHYEKGMHGQVVVK